MTHHGAGTGASVQQILAVLADRVSGAELQDVQAFAQGLLHRVDADELASRPAEAWATLAAGLHAFMAERPEGSTRVRSLNPEGTSQGEPRHSVIQVITDDMPFLVDSVGMAIARAGQEVHLVIHPVFRVRRDADGRLLGIDGERGEGQAESVMHFEFDRSDAATLSRCEEAVRAALADVRQAVADWQPMRARMLAIAEDLGRRPATANGDSAEAQAFLRWAADDNFTFLGYREYEVVQQDGDELLQAVGGSGLGILGTGERSLAPRSLSTLAASELPRSGSIDAIILTKTNARSTVHRPGYMDYIGVLGFNAEGKPVSEQRFLGLYTTNAYMARPQDVPLVRRKVEAIMQRSGLRRDAHSGKALRHVLELLPRDELFQGSEDELYAIASGILALRQRPHTRLFIRRDRYGRFYSCLVYLPRERFSTEVRERVETLLKDALRGERLDSSVRLGETPLAHLHLVIRPRPGDQADYDVAELERAIAAIMRNWHDDLREVLVTRHGEEKGLALAGRFARGLSAGYIEEVTPEVAAGDVETAAELGEGDAMRVALYPSTRRPGALHFKLFRRSGDIALSDVIPLLENMGVRVLTEQLYELATGDERIFIQDITVEPAVAGAFGIDEVGEALRKAFVRIWHGDAENDGFNRLVLAARLDWRQIGMLRGYCKFLLQTGVPFSQSYMEDTLNRYPVLAGLLVELFEAAFDPRRETAPQAERDAAAALLRKELDALVPEAALASHPQLIDDLVASRALPRAEQIVAIVAGIQALLEQVASLDEDRILRAWLGAIGATLRTSYFQRKDGEQAPYIAFKFDSSRIPDLPKPVPYREIFVVGPRVEGTHLRFGAVARGGLRWSDRREDFRTEVLGLVKAQMVKNTIIVPVGSKGGFIVKRPPTDREALAAEGVACYRMFISGMLDITDNLVDDKVVHPVDVVRHDADDPYLVVAADKGTARFSDIANALSADYGFWMGDAFASGGSVGYDHKGMGITARGAWESVKRHFRALGHDTQSEDFTVVGIGDMSGDVFGNGMRLSRHIRLLAAFDHRHIFIDPDPDAATSFEERDRLFKLPRSSWDDYDKSLISKGGGVYARDARVVELSDEAVAALGLPGNRMSPNELVSAVLRAPVDLLWNGGIGTYVKGSGETHAQVGDRANNGVRINGGELRCRVVGEGGNLGFTQQGRIEAAEKGVLLNTDFIDNSAGVGTSDREVNIKILLNDAVQRGELTVEDRNSLLKAMTGEVAHLVLNDNYRQNQAITVMEQMSAERIGSNAHFIRTLEAEGLLDRVIEDLPSDAELAERQARGQGLTRPELAVLLAYSKLKLYEELVASDVPEDPFLSKELVRYFPEPLREPYADSMQRHRLKREIIATAVTNSIVNRMDATFMLRMQEDTGQVPAAIAKAYSAVREVMDARSMWAGIEALDGKVAEAVQIDALLKIWELLRSLTRWLLNRGGAPEIAAIVERYGSGVAALKAALPATLTATGQANFDVDVEKWQGLGIPADLALRLAHVPVLAAAFDICEVARETGCSIERVAAVYFHLGEALDLDGLRRQIEGLPVESRWHAQARGSLRDELAAQRIALTSRLLASAGSDEAEPVSRWLAGEDDTLRFTIGLLEELRAQPVDYPMASVALRRLAQLVQSVGPA